MDDMMNFQLDKSWGNLFTRKVRRILHRLMAADFSHTFYMTIKKQSVGQFWLFLICSFASFDLHWELKLAFTQTPRLRRSSKIHRSGIPLRSDLCRCNSAFTVSLPFPLESRSPHCVRHTSVPLNTLARVSPIHQKTFFAVSKTAG